MQKKHPRVMLALGWYDYRLHQGIAQYALKAGWHLCADITREKTIPWGWKGDGVLAWLGADDELAKFVWNLKLPTVDFSCRRMKLPFARVVVDDNALAQLPAEHFLTRGFKHFMYYSAHDNWAFESHGQSYVQLLKEAGHHCEWIRWHQSKVFTTGHTQWQDKRRWLGLELKKAPKPLALFAATDDHALEVIEACENIGIRVPEEVSVVGLDNSLPAVEAMNTPISSVDQNFTMLGYRGAEVLDQLMHGKPVPPKPILIPPAGLIARQSSDLLAINHPRIGQSLKYLWANYHKPIHVDDLARVAAMSRTSFHHAFAEHVGRSPGNELNRVRMENAKKVLKESKMKIGQIAEICGYQSANSFWVAFKQSTGMSPRQYQKKFTFPED